MTTNFASGSLHLTQAIEQTLGYPLSESVRRAFLSINRLAFVPSHYVKDGYQWREQPAGPEVYENQFFWTHLDQRGIPDSSSSQPSLMASMLEALDLTVGQRVLEIGTGTGYNAALMGVIVGATGQVISVDVAPDLVQRAAERFDDQAWVQTITADGFHGYSACAPYDRIIVTGGSPTISSVWIEQLCVDGLLVGNLSNRRADAGSRTIFSVKRVLANALPLFHPYQFSFFVLQNNRNIVLRVQKDVVDGADQFLYTCRIVTPPIFPASTRI